MFSKLLAIIFIFDAFNDLDFKVKGAPFGLISFE